MRGCPGLLRADGYGAIVNSSRAILYAYRQESYRAFGEERLLKPLERLFWP